MAPKRTHQNAIGNDGTDDTPKDKKPAVVPSPKRQRLNKPATVSLSSYDEFNDPTLNFQPKTFALYEVPTIREVKASCVPVAVTNFVAFDSENRSLEVVIWAELATAFIAACANATFPIKATFRGTYQKKDKTRYSLQVDCDWPIGIRKDGAAEIVEQASVDVEPAEMTIMDAKRKCNVSKPSSMVHKNIRLEVFSDKAVFGGETICDVSDGIYRARMVAASNSIPFDLQNGATIRLNTFKCQFEFVNNVQVFTLKPLSPVTQLFPDGDDDPLAVRYDSDDLAAIPFITADDK